MNEPSKVIVVHNRFLVSYDMYNYSTNTALKKAISVDQINSIAVKFIIRVCVYALFFVEKQKLFVEVLH